MTTGRRTSRGSPHAGFIAVTVRRVPARPWLLAKTPSYDFRFESLAAFVKAHQEALKA